LAGLLRRWRPLLAHHSAQRDRGEQRSGYLLRLQSGRLVLVWNRPAPEGGTWPCGTERALGGRRFLYREELSIALSDDDGGTWTQRWSWRGR